MKSGVVVVLSLLFGVARAVPCIAESEDQTALEKGQMRLGMDVRIMGSTVVPGLPISLALSYSNRTSEVLEYDGLFQFGLESPGVEAEVIGQDGKPTGKSPGSTGSQMSQQIAPREVLRGKLVLPESLTPKEPGEYRISVEYQYGMVRGTRYFKTFIVRPPPVFFKMERGASSPLALVAGNAEDAPMAWRKALAEAEKGDLEEFAERSGAPSSPWRPMVVRSFGDTNVASSARLVLGHALLGNDIPFDEGIFRTAASANESRDVRLMAISLMLRVRGKGEQSTHGMLLKLLREPSVSSDCVLKLAVLSKLVRSSDFSSDDLEGILNKEKDGNVRLAGCTLLVSQGAPDKARNILRMCRGDRTPVNVDALTPYMSANPSDTIGSVAEAILRGLDSLDKK